MKMHVLSGGRLRMRKSIFLPEADRAELIDLPVSSILLRHGQGNVLFDTGCHPSVAENPEGRWGGMAKFMTPIMAPGEHVLTGLAGLGLAPDDIDVVVNSHFHPDHCGCNAYFTKATVVVHRLELEAARAPDASAGGYMAVDWDHPMKTDALDGERDLFGDGRAVLLPLPGHSPGSIGLLAALERSGRFFMVADAASLEACIDRDVIPKNTWNKELFAKSLVEIRRVRAGGAQVVCGHDLAQWERLKKGADAYD